MISSKKSGRLFSRVVLLLLVLGVVASATGYSSSIQKAAGFSPTVNSEATVATVHATSAATASTTITAAGDLILLVVAESYYTLSCPPAVTSVTSTSSYTFVSAYEACESNAAMVGTDYSIWYATAASTTAQTMTVNFAATVYGLVTVYEVSGVLNAPAAAGISLISTTFGGTGTLTAAVGSQSFTGPAFLVAGFSESSSSTCFAAGSTGTECGNGANSPNSGCSVSSGCYNPTLTPGSGFAGTTTKAMGVNECQSAANDMSTSCGQFDTQYTIAQQGFSPTTFPFTVGYGSTTAYNFGVVEIWAIFGVGGTVTTTTSTSIVTTTATVASTTITNVVGSVSVGQCGAKDDTTEALSNSTMYYYTVPVSGIGSFTNITLGLGTVTASIYGAGTPLEVALYYVNQPSASPLYPFNLVKVFQFGFSSAESNSKQVVPLAALSSTTFNGGGEVAIAVLGTNHIRMNESALAISSYSLTAVSGGLSSLPSSFSGGSSGTGLYFCGHFVYTALYPVTVTQTVTAFQSGGTSTSSCTQWYGCPSFSSSGALLWVTSLGFDAASAGWLLTLGVIVSLFVVVAMAASRANKGQARVPGVIYEVPVLVGMFIGGGLGWINPIVATIVLIGLGAIGGLSIAKRI